jgi:photosystem II stability/assembly factor-like uncharacterized protein
MNNDSYLTLFITIFIILSMLSKTHISIQNQSVLIHFSIILFIVFLFCVKYEKSAFMASLLYLIVYSHSYKLKEYLTGTAASANLPQHSLNKTLYPSDKIAENILLNNNLPSQLTYWFTSDSFNSSLWRDLASNNHIQFEASNVRLNSSSSFSSSTNKTSGPQKWVSGDITSQLIIPLPASASANSITFIHLTRYSPRSSNRGKIWSSSTGAWVSGYNDNTLSISNPDGKDASNNASTKSGDIMNIRGSNWNLFFDQMDMTNKTRTVLVNGSDYIFQNSMQAIPDKIGLNVSTSTSDKSDWDCAEIMIYPRILDSTEIQKIMDYLNKKYSIQYPAKIEANKYNIYNHYTFSSISDNEWQSPPQVGSTTYNGNKLLGIADSEYECVSLCDKNTPSCAAFSYHMEKGACYSVDEKNILHHTTPNKATLSGTNKVREIIAQKAKEEAERKAAQEAKEEAERKRLADIEAAKIEAERRRLAAIEAERKRIEAIEAERRRLAAIEAERIAKDESERRRLAAIEAERIAKEEAERRRLANIEAERIAKARAEEIERENEKKRGQIQYINMQITQSNNTGRTMYLCCSGNGQYVYQATLGPLYRSTDYGHTFMPLSTENTEWSSISCDQTGQIIFATTWGGIIYKSTDYGNSWGGTVGPQIVSCGGVHISRDGRYMFTFYMGGKMAWSYDNGVNWQLRLELKHDTPWTMFYPSIQIASSAQFNRIYTCSGGFSGKPVMSANYGSSWQTVDLPEGPWAWTGVGCNYDGMIAYFAADNGFVYKTTNYGSSWEQFTKLGKKRWRSVSCSSNGAIVTISTVGEGVFHTKDGGLSWNRINLYGNNDSYFTTQCGSYDGSIHYVGISQGGIIVIR